jgi:hypothetical protein
MEENALRDETGIKLEGPETVAVHLSTAATAVFLCVDQVLPRFDYVLFRLGGQTVGSFSTGAVSGWRIVASGRDRCAFCGAPIK